MTMYEQHQYSPLAQRVIERAREAGDASDQRSALTSKIAQRPWASFGVALLAGYTLGRLGGSEESKHDTMSFRSYAPPRTSQYSSALRDYSASAPAAPAAPVSVSGAKTDGEGVTTYRGGEAPTAAPTPSARPDTTSHTHDKPGMIEQITSQFGGEIDTLKSTAVAAVIGLIRDTVQQNLPAVHREMERMRAERGGPAAGSTPSGASFGTPGTAMRGTAADDTPAGPVFGAASADHGTAMR